MVETATGHSVDLPADWLQGRTAYGGLTASLCVESALRHAPDLPPLRSAQFALVGPAGGLVHLSPEVVRRGKSSVVVSVNLDGEAGPAARSLLTFGASRPSLVDYSAMPAPAVPPPGDCPSFFNPDTAPSFARHFDVRRAGGQKVYSPDSLPELLVWIRHGDAAARSGLTGLIALADALPPPVLVLFSKPGPFSTMTWSIDLAVDAPASASGWWLVHSQAQAAATGYSTQSMTIWDDQGGFVLAARQTVAIFV